MPKILFKYYKLKWKLFIFKYLKQIFGFFIFN